MGKQCQRHTMLESGGSTTLGQRYALFVKARNGINHVKAIKTADKVLSPYLESQGFLSLEADNIKTDEEWAAVIAAIKGDKQVKGIRIVSDHGVYDMHKSIKEHSPSNQETRKSKSNYHQLQVRVSNLLINSIKTCLVVNNGISCLDLSGFPISLTALQVLDKALAKNSSLTHLSLARTRIGDRGLSEIRHGLRHNCTLIILNFAGCNLTSKSAMVFAEVLKSQAVRRQADNWSNTLRVYNPRALSEARLNKKDTNGVVRLSLSCNDLGNRGCTIIAESLKEDIGLKAVDLQKNKITDIGAKSIEQMLRVNSDLEICDLRNNSIGALLMKSIEELLSKNTTLISSSEESLNDIKVTGSLLHMLNPTDPLKNTYINYPSEKKRHQHQTLSSVQKKSLVISKPTLIQTKERSHFQTSSPIIKKIISGLQKNKSKTSISSINSIGKGKNKSTVLLSNKKKPKKKNPAVSSGNLYQNIFPQKTPKVEWVHDDDGFASIQKPVFVPSSKNIVVPNTIEDVTIENINLPPDESAHTSPSAKIAKNSSFMDSVLNAGQNEEDRVWKAMCDTELQKLEDLSVDFGKKQMDYVKVTSLSDDEEYYDRKRELHKQTTSNKDEYEYYLADIDRIIRENLEGRAKPSTRKPNESHPSYVERPLEPLNCQSKLSLSTKNLIDALDDELPKGTDNMHSNSRPNESRTMDEINSLVGMFEKSLAGFSSLLDRLESNERLD